MHNRQFVKLFIGVCMVFLLYGCSSAVETPSPTIGEPVPTAVPIQPTNTAVSTSTPEPTATLLPKETSTSLPPTITAQPERSVESIDELFGVWKGYWSDINMMYLNILPSQRAEVSFETVRGAFSSDRFSFADGIFTWGVNTFATSTPQKCLDNPVATYEVYIVYRDDQPEKLRFVLVGEDNCDDRKEFLNGNTLTWVGPEIP